ncbi:MAG: hypothetical protein HY938_05450 [Nitrosomonadales bacterium]|nr:hypothetical protein [Nitrosomonadales bacterium]
MHDPAERSIGLFLAMYEIDGHLDIILDYATARLIVSVGIALLIVMFV